MASAWSQLDQLLTCAICLDRYRNPKLLPCQHTFCMEPCLEGLIDYARRQIKCPECRAEHRIPYQGVQAFPTNVTLMRFLELHRDITGEEPEPPPSMMERCNVCSEKSYLEKCAHCEKKICQDCKEAHVDILRREINRINNQVRRGLHRLSEALTQTKKNAEKLQLNCTQVKDEIEDIVRRYSKDLRNTEDKLKHDLEIYTETELKSINKLKEDLEAEMTNMSSNCDLVDKYIKDDAEWSDAELLEYKEIFLKTLDFLRAFDADNSDFARRIKFQPRADPDVLHRNIADFGELKISAPSVPTQQSLAPPQSNALMRSQSDHRLAAQFARRQDNRSFADINQRYGSDTEREGRPTSPLFSRTSRRDTDTGYRRYSERSRDYDYQDRDVGRNRYIREENSSSSISSRWRDSEDYGYRSRYNRDYDDFESEPQNTRTVRFADDPPQNQTQRERLLDMGDATKGPLSGIIRLMDSPKVMERLHQNEVRQKQQQNDKERKAQEPPATPQPAPPPPAPTTPAAPQPPPRRPPSRQQSEDDIDRQKKMNQQQAASSTTPATPATPAVQQTQNSNTTTTTNTEPQPRPISRRVTALQKEDETKASSPGDRGQRKDNRSPDVSESTASPRSDVTTHDECPEAPTRSRRQLSTTSSTETDLPESPSSPRASESPRRADSPRLLSRCPRPTLGKAVSLDAESGSQPAKTPLDKKVPHQVDQQQKKSEEEEDDDDEQEEEEVLRPRQSSFYSRLTNNNHRRLPDPEPRLLQEPDNSSDEEEDEENDDDDEEEELADDKTLSVKQGDNAEESDSEVSSSSSSSSESEDSEEPEETKVQNEPIPSVTTSTGSQRKDIHSSKVASTNNIPNKKPENPSETTSDDEDDDDDEDDADENGATIETSNKPNADSTVRVRSSGAEETSSDGTSFGSRRKSDDADATDSSSSSSNQYQSLSHNSTPIVSNGNMAAEENLSSEGSSSATSSGSTSSHRREPRYSGYRRGLITRSKSSHELGLGTENVEDEEDDEPIIPTYRSRYDRMSEGSNALSRSRSHHALKSNDHSPEETNTTAALSSSSNSSWAKYLRSKYGSNATSRVVPRSRSSHNLYSRSDSETSEDDGTSGRDSILSGSYGFSNPRSTYVQKRRMMLKIGARGTDASCFTWPRGVAVGPDNSIVVADSSNHRVQVFDAIGKFLHEFGTYGSAEGEFDCLAGVAVNRIGQFIVSDRYNHRIQLFDPSGRFLRSFGCEGRTDGRFNYPWGITTDSLGFIYVCDKENHRIQVFQSDGTFVGKFGSIGSRPGQLEHPHYIAVSNTNRVVVSDSNNHRIQIFDVNGRSLSTFGSEGSEEGQFKFPRGVAVDDQGYIIVGDSGNNRVQIFHPDGTFLRGFGNWGSGDGEFKGLEGIAVTSGGSILVCDRENHRIQVF